MNLSFLPGELYLTKTQDGAYVITVEGKEVFRSRVEKKALTQFNKIRKEMESKFPAHELTTEQKTAALEKWMMDTAAREVRNSTRLPKKEKMRGTRTFG